MGLFGSEEEKREEVTLGVSEDKETEDETNDASPEVGAINFESEDESESEESGNLRDEVSNLDSVTETSDSSSKTSSSRKNSSELDDLKKQNQKIIEKLDKVLSKL